MEIEQLKKRIVQLEKENAELRKESISNTTQSNSETFQTNTTSQHLFWECDHDLNADQVNRYSRQLLLSSFGPEGKVFFE